MSGAGRKVRLRHCRFRRPHHLLHHIVVHRHCHRLSQPRVRGSIREPVGGHVSYRLLPKVPDLAPAGVVYSLFRLRSVRLQAVHRKWGGLADTSPRTVAGMVWPNEPASRQQPQSRRVALRSMNSTLAASLPILPQALASLLVHLLSNRVTCLSVMCPCSRPGEGTQRTAHVHDHSTPRQSLHRRGECRSTPSVRQTLSRTGRRSHLQIGCSQHDQWYIVAAETCHSAHGGPKHQV